MGNKNGEVTPENRLFAEISCIQPSIFRRYASFRGVQLKDLCSKVILVNHGPEHWYSTHWERRSGNGSMFFKLDAKFKIMMR